MKIRLDAFLLRVQFLLLAGIIVTQALGVPGLPSVLFTATFFGTVCLWLAKAGERIGKLAWLALAIVILSGISVCFDALINSTVVSFGYYKKWIMFCTTVLLLSAAGSYVPEKRDVDFLFFWNAALACFLTGMYVLRTDQMHLLNGMVTVYLTFRFTNPNLAAVFLCGIGMVEGIHAAACSGRKERLFHGGLALAMLFFVTRTRSRNGLLVLAVFLAACLVCYCCPTGKRKIPDWAAAAVAAAPLLFALGYLLLIRVPQVEQAFSFLTGEGKGLDSRVRIWQFALESFGKSPVFGAYGKISGGTGASQMHNSHLDVLASYGAPVFLLVWGLLFLLLREKNWKIEPLHFLCKAGFSALLLSGIGEAMLFSGGMGIYLYAGVLQVLANYQFTDGGKTDADRLCQ